VLKKIKRLFLLLKMQKEKRKEKVCGVPLGWGLGTLPQARAGEGWV
jgi:hypothetical protein